MAVLQKQTGDALVDRTVTGSTVAVLVSPFIHWAVERMVAAGLNVGPGYEAQLLVAVSGIIITGGVWLKKRAIARERAEADAADDRLPPSLHTILDPKAGPDATP